MKSQRPSKQFKTWPAGFLITVNVAFVLCDMSVSDELCKLAELSLQAVVLSVLLESAMDEVSSGGGCGSGILLDERLGTGLGITEMEFGSVFKGSNASDAVEIVLTLWLSKEGSVSIGLEILCEEACESSSSDGTIDMVLALLTGGCSTSGICISRSFNESTTASMNI